MERRITAPIALALAFILGCKSPSRVDETMLMLQIQTDKLVYAPGDSLRMSVANHGAVSVQYFPCPVIVTREAGTSREELGTLPGYGPGDCDAIARQLEPAEVRVIQARLDPRLASGT